MIGVSLPVPDVFTLPPVRDKIRRQIHPTPIPAEVGPILHRLSSTRARAGDILYFRSHRVAFWVYLLLSSRDWMTFSASEGETDKQRRHKTHTYVCFARSVVSEAYERDWMFPPLYSLFTDIVDRLRGFRLSNWGFVDFFAIIFLRQVMWWSQERTRGVDALFVRARRRRVSVIYERIVLIP